MARCSSPKGRSRISDGCCVDLRRLSTGFHCVTLSGCTIAEVGRQPPQRSTVLLTANAATPFPDVGQGGPSLILFAVAASSSVRRDLYLPAAVARPRRADGAPLEATNPKRPLAFEMRMAPRGSREHARDRILTGAWRSRSFYVILDGFDLGGGNAVSADPRRKPGDATCWRRSRRCGTATKPGSC
jgi:hypothetical protein